MSSKSFIIKILQICQSNSYPSVYRNSLTG